MEGIEGKEQREQRIKREEDRLSKFYKGISSGKRSLNRGLIQRAAFMRITLAELEDDLNTYGYTEWFSQGDQTPYQRKRPAADLYNTMNANCQKIMKQLTDLLPKDDMPAAKKAAVDTDDGFEDFVNGRED